MPELGGLAATRRLAELGARARVLVLTMSEDDDSVFAALRAGAGGYSSRAPTPTRSSPRCGRWPGAMRSSDRTWPAGC